MHAPGALCSGMSDETVIVKDQAPSSWAVVRQLLGTTGEGGNRPKNWNWSILCFRCLTLPMKDSKPCTYGNMESFPFLKNRYLAGEP